MKVSSKGYRYLVPLLLPAAALYLLWRARKQPDYLKNWGERFAIKHFPSPRQAHPRIWIHAVSVGETNATRPLIKALLQKWPECDILLTHMTPTGRDAGAKIVALAPDRIQQCFLPYDTVCAMRKFLRETAPVMAIIMETEVWPTAIKEARAMGIPVVLANGRLSEKSFQKSISFGPVMNEAMQNFSVICAQSSSDAERYRKMGVKEIVVTGSMKFDITAPEQTIAKACAFKDELNRKVVLLASTRDGEEAKLIDAIVEYRKKQGTSSTLYVLVPRHPQRFAEVRELLNASGLKTQIRSETSQAQDIQADTVVYLGNTMGEMFFYCGIADVALMGGSFENFGCQNIIEPASVGVPVIVGPSTFNFAQVVEQAQKMQAVQSVATAHEAIDLANAWLADETHLAQSKSNALKFSKAYVGATQRHLEVLESLCKK